MATSSNGSLTERYQIKKHLGSGGNGDAYLAFDTSLRREIVIKRVRTGENDEKLSQEIMEEAARMAALKHPNIVSIYDISLIEGTPCIVMEFVQGRTLEEWVHANGAFDTEAFVELARQTLDALACAHQTNLIHRDIKPSNIMLVDLPSGLFQAKVLDFGLAKFLNTDAPSPQTVNIDGSIKGSVHFISPEQLNHEAVDARSDLYSLGCSLYLALTSIEPFAGESVAGIIAAHLTHRVIPAKDVLNTVPPAINEWLMKMMGRRTVDRFQTALEAMQALEIAAQKSGVSSATRAIRVDRRSATVKTTPSKSRGMPWAVIASAVVVCGGLATAFLLSGKKNEEAPSNKSAVAPAIEKPADPAPSPSQEPVAAIPATPVEAAPTPAPVVEAAIPPAPVEKAPEKAEVIMEVVGSNTIGAKLMPQLIEAFLERMKMTGLDTEEIKAEESEIRFVSPLGDGHKAIAVKAHGSSTAFKELLAGSCDIGMASRPIKDEEIQNLAVLGDMRSSGCEHVVGLDGLAVIVNKSNPVSQLTVQQIAALFSGEIRDWSEVGGAPGPVTLYARDDKSGTFDSFKSLVLDKKALNTEARRFEDSNALSDGVAADPSGIGFIGLPYVRATKALALSDAGTAPMLPSPFTVATEDYVLSRRLYLYTPAVPKNAWTTNFVEFVLSDEGQDIVEKSGFIPQRINLETMTSSPDMAESYRSLIEQGVGRLSLTFRFQPKQKELDAKAVRDFDRVLRYLAKPENRQKKIYLLGFSDSIGEASTNLKLARERADVVARQLTMRGIAVASTIALGEEMPVATNDTEAGREKNRRVEIWIQGPAGITKL
jgi:phosphate transport system substrate-binding protein